MAKRHTKAVGRLRYNKVPTIQFEINQVIGGSRAQHACNRSLITFKRAAYRCREACPSDGVPTVPHRTSYSPPSPRVAREAQSHHIYQLTVNMLMAD